MKWLFLLPLVLITFPAAAQDISDQPICFTVRNEAPYRIYGEIGTDRIENPDGQMIRHTGTFRLEKPGTVDPDTGYPKDVSEFCSSGPFFPGRQLNLTLRSLFPIFSCRTSVELGEIIVKGQLNEDGTSKTWAVCY